jgi:peptidoglycan/xylan/chitin deacetylase (PgdA/CDA1 family)
MKSLARKAVKAAVMPLAIPSRRRPGDVVVLCYHKVGVGDREIDVPRRPFERQLAHLAERERVRSLDDALADAEGGVVITIDDGYRDFSDHVVPLLVRYRLPALLYLATGLVANGNGAPADPEALTWSMLREAVDTGLVTIGAHTHHHVDLSRVSADEARQEMRECKETVEDRLGVPCRHFAYPWGRGSAAAQEAAAELFESAALVGWKTNHRGRIEPQRLGRTPILRSDGPVFFRAKLAGLLDSEAVVYRALRRGPWAAPAAARDPASAGNGPR